MILYCGHRLAIAMTAGGDLEGRRSSAHTFNFFNEIDRAVPGASRPHLP
jgi:hypothetical protein